MERLVVQPGRGAVAGFAAAASLIAAVAVAALILGGGLAADPWPGAAGPAGAPPLHVGRDVPGAAAALARASASSAQTPAHGLPRSAPGVTGARAASRQPAITSHVAAAHVPQPPAAAIAQPAPQRGRSPGGAGVEAAGEATGAAATRAGGSLGGALAPASPPVARAVARAAASVGAAAAEGGRSAAEIIRRLRARR